MDTLAQTLLRQLEMLRDMKRSHQIVPDTVRHAGSEEVVLVYGRPYERAPEQPYQMGYGACFANASYLAAEHPRELAYCEGWAVQKDLPLAFHHAWVVDRRTGLVVDPTWDSHASYCSSYYGVALNIDYVVGIQRASKSYAMFECPNLEQFCRGGVPPWAIETITPPKPSKRGADRRAST